MAEKFLVGNPSENITRDGDDLKAVNARLLFCEDYCDAHFKINRQIIPVHSALLRIQSPVFSEMFSDKWKKDEPIEIKGFEADDMRSVLRWIYCRELVIRNESLQFVLFLADKYGLQSLVDYVTVLFELEPYFRIRALKLLSFAIATGNEGLKRKCTDYIADNASYCLMSFQFMETNSDTIAHLIKSPQMRAKGLDVERDLFQSCVTWAQLECINKYLPQTAVNFRKMMEDFIHLFSFPDWDLQTFVSTVCRTNILTAYEQTAVFRSHFEVVPAQPFYRAEKKIRFQIPIASLQSTLDSEKVSMRGIQWWVTSEPSSDSKSVDLSVNCSYTESHWFCDAELNLKLVQHDDLKSSRVRDFVGRFKPYWNVRSMKFFTMSEVGHPQNGWQENGHIVIEVRIFASKPVKFD